MPRHVAIIMDGNGRWAQEQGKERLFGHAKGYETLRNVVDWCGVRNIEFLTVYGFSSENWRRSDDEVDGLMALIERAMLEQIANLKESNVRVRVTGRIHELPPTLQAALKKGADETAHCTGLNFTLAINYGGRAEILDAARQMVSAPEWSEEEFGKRLYQPDLPDVDLMIRTAGEVRWSNFLLWQAAYAELYVCPCTWPEFSEAELDAALNCFGNRTRKFGAVV